MNQFPEIDHFHELLNKIAEEIPEDFFKDLNGGIILLEQAKKHNRAKRGQPLYIMGQYRRDVLGRQIIIYYGSFKRVHKNVSEAKLYQEIKDTLIHEFTHHLESLAGERGLEKKDEQRMREYLQRK